MNQMTKLLINNLDNLIKSIEGDNKSSVSLELDVILTLGSIKGFITRNPDNAYAKELDNHMEWVAKCREEAALLDIIEQTRCLKLLKLAKEAAEMDAFSREYHMLIQNKTPTWIDLIREGKYRNCIYKIEKAEKKFHKLIKQRNITDALNTVQPIFNTLDWFLWHEIENKGSLEKDATELSWNINRAMAGFIHGMVLESHMVEALSLGIRGIKTLISMRSDGK